MRASVLLKVCSLCCAASAVGLVANTIPLGTYRITLVEPERAGAHVNGKAVMDGLDPGAVPTDFIYEDDEAWWSNFVYPTFVTLGSDGAFGARREMIKVTSDYPVSIQCQDGLFAVSPASQTALRGQARCHLDRERWKRFSMRMSIGNIDQIDGFDRFTADVEIFYDGYDINSDGLEDLGFSYRGSVERVE